MPVDIEDLTATSEPEELTPEQKEAIAIIEETALMGRKPKPERVVDPYEGDDSTDDEEEEDSED